MRPLFLSYVVRARDRCDDEEADIFETLSCRPVGSRSLPTSTSFLRFQVSAILFGNSRLKKIRLRDLNRVSVCFSDPDRVQIDDYNFTENSCPIL
jgi:hypothetical protein